MTDDLHDDRFRWWRPGEPCIIDGQGFHGALGIFVGRIPGSQPLCELLVGRRQRVVGRIEDIRRPRGVFPRDDYVFHANYDRDSCPRESWERWFFLRLLDEDIDKQVGCASAFCAMVHLHRRST